MDDPRGLAERTFEHAVTIEKELHSLIKTLRKQNEAPVLQRDVEQKLAQMRDAFEAVIFVDVQYADEKDVDERMWNKQHQVIEHFRSALHALHQANMVKKRPVELRKLSSMFVNSIKSAMKFFRLYIQHLASQFNVIELESIIKEFKFEINPPKTKRQLLPEEKNLVVKSCYMALIRLGDLSRYREMHSIPDSKKENKGKNWGPVVGYYNLAKQLRPDLGNAYNQLAVISMAEGSNLSVIYQLYRALSVPEPIEKTNGNLGTTFKKVLKAYQAGNLNVPNRRDEQAVEDLLLLFIRFHAQCYTGIEPAENESLKSEMLNQLTLAVKDRSVAGNVLNKIVLVNIAAEFHAAKQKQQLKQKQKQQLRAPPSSTNYLRLNIETFTSLLLVLQQELERVSSSEQGGGGGGVGVNPEQHQQQQQQKQQQKQAQHQPQQQSQPSQKPSQQPSKQPSQQLSQQSPRPHNTQQRKHLSEYVTAVARRMLPSLRLYSSWLLVNHPTLTDQLADTSLNVQIKQLWQIYASAMSLLLATFPMRSLDNVDYILEEDADVLGFLPFQENTMERTRDLKMLSTTSSGRENERGHPNDETLARILFLLEDVVELCTYENVPIAARDNTFAFDDGIISTQTSNMHSSNQYPPITVRDIPKSQFVRGSSSRAANSVSKPERSIHMGSVVSEAVSSTMTTKLNAMVDDLVGPNIQPNARSSKMSQDDEEEEIVFKGKKVKAKQGANMSKLDAAAARAGKTLHDTRPQHHLHPQMSQPQLPSSPQKAHAETAMDLVNFVQNYSQSLTLSTPNTPRQADAVASANWNAPQAANYSSLHRVNQQQHQQQALDRMNMPPPQALQTQWDERYDETVKARQHQQNYYQR